ncbi:MAG: hypothetical protein H7248_06170 [Microbacteriaceae bacterium]|nr:hypothetical protein [Microbacteriaceae bacterium]
MLKVQRSSSSPVRADGSPKISRIVDEGLLIALSAVRMAIKNRLIVGALRDFHNYDQSEYGQFAIAQITLLAEQNRADAKRVAIEKRSFGPAVWVIELTPDQRSDVKLLNRRRRVYKRLATALLAVGADAQQVSELVETARIDAGAEISDALQTRLIDRVIDPREPDYEFERPDRLRTLSDDLAALLAAREITPRG